MNGTNETGRLIEKYLPVDYHDTFSVQTDVNGLSPAEIITRIFSYNPAWLRALYKCRAFLVKPFGIETRAPQVKNLIVEENEREAIMRMDDSHLLFYVSVFICPEERGRQTTEISTWVKYHNRIGKSLFFLYQTVSSGDCPTGLETGINKRVMFLYFGSLYKMC